MAEITVEDRANLTKLRMFAGPELADFAAKMMKMKGQNPALDQAGDAFSAQASDWKNMAKLKDLNEQFRKNPQLAGKMEQLLKENPQAFEKHVSRMFANPDQTLTIVEEQLQAKPATAPVSAPTPAATPVELAATPAGSVDAKPPFSSDPSDPRSPNYNPLAPRGRSDIPIPAEEFSPEPKRRIHPMFPPAEIAELNQSLDSSAKFAEISKASGFDGLMERINKNPHLQDMFKGMTDGDPQKSSEMIDTLHEQIKEDPDFLNKVNKTIDNTPPGTMSTVASLIANDTRSGFAAFGILNGLQNSSMGSLLQNGMVMNLMGSVLPMIAQMMQFLTGNLNKVKGFVTDHLKDSGDVMAQESKPGMTARALEAVGANPKSVTMVDATGASAKTDIAGIKQGATDAPKPSQFNKDHDTMSSPKPSFGSI